VEVTTNVKNLQPWCVCLVCLFVLHRMRGGTLRRSIAQPVLGDHLAISKFALKPAQRSPSLCSGLAGQPRRLSPHELWFYLFEITKSTFEVPFALTVTGFSHVFGGEKIGRCTLCSVSTS
jgi:hypothetical protein